MDISRAKRADVDKWCYGTPVVYRRENKIYNSMEIIENGKIVELIDIKPETVCRKSRYYDKNNLPIYEKDVVVTSGGMTGLVILQNDEYYFEVVPELIRDKSAVCRIPLSVWTSKNNKIRRIEIIGNLTDNPEINVSGGKK